MPRPELSVVVCSVGTAPLARALASILASRDAAAASVEVIVVWQGTEPVPDLATGVSAIDVFPVSLSYARNRGLEAASAPFVAFVDDDEVVDEGWVRGLLDAFAASGSAALFGEVAPLDDHGIPYCEVSGDAPREFRRPSTPPWVVGTGGNMAFRRADLVSSGAFDITLGAGAPGLSAEESDVIVRFLRDNRAVAWTPNAVVFHPTKTEAEHLAARRPYAYGMGVLARRRRDVGLAARYGVAAAQSWITGARTRDRRRRREAIYTMAGLAEGLLARDRFSSPERFLTWMPAEITQAVAGRELRAGPASYGTVPEFRYSAPGVEVQLLVGPGAEATLAAGPGTTVVRDRDATWVART